MSAPLRPLARSLAHAPRVQPATLPRLAPLALARARAASSQSSSSKPAVPTPGARDLPPQRQPLSWASYLSLRRTRRLAGVLTTIPTTLLSLATSGSVLLTQPVDPTSPPLLGIDPVYLYAAATLACGGLGYLVGPSIGTFFWNVVHKRERKDVEAMDSVFWSKIERNRVDPSRQTMQNRLPDFYGEKIASIPQYRQWLRDQAAFRRKTSHGVNDDLPQ